MTRCSTACLASLLWLTSLIAPSPLWTEDASTGEPAATADAARRAIAGKWTLNSFEQDGAVRKREDNPKLFDAYSELQFDGEFLRWPKHKDRSRWPCALDPTTDPMRMTLSLPDNHVRAIFRYDTASAAPSQLTIQLPEQAGAYPTGFDTRNASDLKLNYFRDEKDPVWLKAIVASIRDHARQILQQEGEAQQRLGRRLLEMADSMAIEQEFREKAASLTEQAEALRGEGEAARAREAEREAKLALHRAEEEFALRQVRQRLQEEEDRMREKVRSLSERAAALRRDGSFDEAEQVELELRRMLLDRDPQLARVNELKRLAADARFEGEHPEADEFDRQADALLEGLRKRYHDGANDDRLFLDKLVASMGAAGEVENSIEESEIRIFRLQHISSGEALEILNQLDIPSPGMTLVNVHEQNSLIAKGRPGSSAHIEALLLRLDEANTDAPAPTTAPTKASVAARSAEYEAMRKRAADMAQQWRREKAKANPSAARLRDLAGSVKRDVQDAFQLRQQMHRDRIDAARRELGRIEQNVRRRDALAEEIVLRRVRELLDPESRWLGPGQTLKVVPAAKPVTGLVVAVDPERALLQLSVGGDDGVRRGMRLEVHRDGTYVGRVEVVELAADRSVARLLEGTDAAPVKAGDRVATRFEATGPDDEEALAGGEGFGGREGFDGGDRGRRSVGDDAIGSGR
ncbi:MAG: hypothetical protein RIC55_36400 [Pirellulaceae bacterium]